MITEWLLTAQSTAKKSYPDPFSEGKPIEQEEFSSKFLFLKYIFNTCNFLF